MALLRSPIACLFAVLIAVSAGGVSIRAQAQDTRPPVRNESTTRQELLDKLFARLKAVRSGDEAKALEVAIQKVWMSSGSASVDLLMSHGEEAMAAKNYGEALYYFDEVVSLAPGYAEGWNKRSAVHYLMENYSAALSDLEHVLRLEPRHFKAMAGLAIILEDLGDKKGALDAYRRALQLDPWLAGVPERIKKLEPEVEGRGI